MDIEQGRYQLEDEVVGLRPARYEDCARIIAWRNTENVKKHYIYREDFTLEQQQKYYREEIETKRTYLFIICDKACGGREVGCTVLNHQEGRDSIEFGIYIGAGGVLSRGLGRHATKLTTDFALDELGFARVVSRIFTDNIASMHCVEGGGMVNTYEVLKDVVCTDGEVKDMFLYEKRKAE